jgi:hypothetical protein
LRYNNLNIAFQGQEYLSEIGFMPEVAFAIVAECRMDDSLPDELVPEQRRLYAQERLM